MEQAETSNGMVAADKDFWERAFLVAFEVALRAEGWRFGDKPITGGNDRCRLAANWADLAVKERADRFCGDDEQDE